MNKIQSIVSMIAIHSMIAGLFLTAIEMLTVAEYAQILIISVIVLIAHLITEHYREALTDQ